MSSTHSGTLQNVDGMPRNQWILCFGFSGRHVPDLVDDFPRIMHLGKKSSVLNGDEKTSETIANDEK